jgi:hypothetical protein
VSRAYAQLCTLVFAVAGVGGLLLGSATHVVGGIAQGNLGNLTLHMTYVHDVLDIVLLVAFIFAGFFTSRSVGKTVVLVCGAVLLVIGVFGAIHGDTVTASKSVAGLNFPTTVNVFNIFFGALGILSALGTLSDEQVQKHEQKSFLRDR